MARTVSLFIWVMRLILPPLQQHTHRAACTSERRTTSGHQPLSHPTQSSVTNQAWQTLKVISTRPSLRPYTRTPVPTIFPSPVHLPPIYTCIPSIHITRYHIVFCGWCCLIKKLTLLHHLLWARNNYRQNTAKRSTTLDSIIIMVADETNIIG